MKLEEKNQQCKEHQDKLEKMEKEIKDLVIIIISFKFSTLNLLY